MLGTFVLAYTTPTKTLKSRISPARMPAIIFSRRRRPCCLLPAGFPFVVPFFVPVGRRAALPPAGEGERPPGAAPAGAGGRRATGPRAGRPAAAPRGRSAGPGRPPPTAPGAGGSHGRRPADRSRARRDGRGLVVGWHEEPLSDRSV